MSVTAAAGEKTHPRSESPPPREPKASATTAAAAVVAVQDAEAASHPPPDGGPLAWLQVAGSFFLFFNSWGILGSYGVFQTYYQAHMTDASVDAIAWIGSIQSCLLLLVGVLVGPLYDAGYFRSLILTGTVLVFVGMAATSFTTRYWQTLLAQAFCVGLGAGCLYIPSVAIIPQYFSARRALATGIATTGSGFGGVIYSLIVQGLLQRRTSGPGPDAGKRRRRRVMLDLAAYRNASFVVLSASMFFNVFSYTPPIYYLQQYSLVYGLAGQGSSGLAYYLVAILNAGSVLGRMFPAWLAGRYGPINVLLGVSVSVATVTMCWLAVRTGAGSVVFALAYGFATGGLISCHVTKRYR
ncbi:MFS general substrate transporter [Colletotrichum sublineola]|nr:MFS general substrate transporter [Colletotrichum sublineola]